jgi:predicted DNA-binding transcriptional regulator YafY
MRRPSPDTRLDRLDLLPRLLRDRPGITTSDLARELGISARSIFRDLDVLRERGYPIEAARGRGGGLRLHPNWGMSKVLLSREEALCTLLGLAIGEKLGLPMFAQEIRRARRKIGDAFPSGERRRLNPLRERILIGAPASASVRSSYGAPSAAAMRSLQVAFVDERSIEADYLKEGAVVSRRRLEPHALVINWPAWYLMAHDRDRVETRTFRFDRFVAVRVEADHFQPRPHEVMRELIGTAGVVLDPV